MTIRIRSSQKIQVTTSLSTQRRQVDRFLQIKAKWIETHLQRFLLLDEKYPPKKLQQDETFPFLGQQLVFRVVVTPLKKAFFSRQEQHLSLHLPENEYQQLAAADLNCYFDKLKLFYKREATQFVGERLLVWAHEMQLKPQKISFRNQKSRWGSCSSRGHISLNWKLIACPLFVVDAILIHELAHLQQMNHSEKFWQLVERYCPQYEVANRWLAQHHRQVDFLLGT